MIKRPTRTYVEITKEHISYDLQCLTRSRTAPFGQHLGRKDPSNDERIEPKAEEAKTTRMGTQIYAQKTEQIRHLHKPPKMCLRTSNLESQLTTTL